MRKHIPIVRRIEMATTDPKSRSPIEFGIVILADDKCTICCRPCGMVHLHGIVYGSFIHEPIEEFRIDKEDALIFVEQIPVIGLGFGG